MKALIAIAYMYPWLYLNFNEYALFIRERRLR
jgi:hypothetical protein